MSSSLFDLPDAGSEPLASRMRPRDLEEFIGQRHILGPGRLLRRAIQADQLGSLIFAGPPGTGKTTLARVIANTTKSYFSSLNAVLSGIKDIKLAVEQAKERKSLHGRRTILFVDEVHRWNKSQQDALLPWVENGTVILIGATTENPWFEVNRALLSRSRVFLLQALSRDELREVAERAIADPVRGFSTKITIEKDALEHLLDNAGGDARNLLNALELAAVDAGSKAAEDAGSAEFVITREIAEQSIQVKAVLYDKDGDYHFDTISAFIKSVRGSDPDAALFWMAKMMEAGEHPPYIFRRMLISASEDVGLADPHALGIVNSAAQAFERVGLPEGQFFLAQAALYLSLAPKSNSTLAYFDASEAVRSAAEAEVPNHLRDASRDAEGLGHGKGYLYPHAFRDHWVAQQYLPSSLKGRIFYHPGSVGREPDLAAGLEQLREIQLGAYTADAEAQITSSSPHSRRLDSWMSRLDAEAAGQQLELRRLVFEMATVSRTGRVAILGSRNVSWFWEAYRRCPEGIVVGIFAEAEIRSLALEKLLPPGADASGFMDQALAVEQVGQIDKELLFDVVLTRGLRSGDGILAPDLQAQAKKLRLEAGTGALISADIVPQASLNISDLLAQAGAELGLIQELQSLEREIEFPELELPQGWKLDSSFRKRFAHPRRLRSEDIQRWTSGSADSPVSQGLAKAMDKPALQDLNARLGRALVGKQLSWEITWEIARLSLT